MQCRSKQHFQSSGRQGLPKGCISWQLLLCLDELFQVASLDLQKKTGRISEVLPKVEKYIFMVFNCLQTPASIGDVCMCLYMCFPTLHEPTVNVYSKKTPKVICYFSGVVLITNLLHSFFFFFKSCSALKLKKCCLNIKHPVCIHISISKWG